MSQFFASGGQSTGASASVSIFPMTIQDWFPLWLTGLISLQCKGLSRVFSVTTVQKHQLFGVQFSLWSISHILTWLLEKTIALTVWTFVGKVMSLIFNMLSRLVITFLPRSKRLLSSCLQSPATGLLRLASPFYFLFSLLTFGMCVCSLSEQTQYLTIYRRQFPDSTHKNTGAS